MKVGDRVRITRINKCRETVGGVQTCDFDVSRCDTGTIVEIHRGAPLGHRPKHYSVQLDPPNSGILTLTGTDGMERIK